MAQRIYNLGDAQIDAQNRVVVDIDPILRQHDAEMNAGTLTADKVRSYRAQIQGLINNYQSSYGMTKRGAAGYRTLQTFVDSNIYPTWDAEINNLSTPTTPQALISIPAIPTSGAARNGGNVTNINVIPNAPGTAAALSPGDTPNAIGPAYSIPGVEQTVTASMFPEWMSNPYVLAGAALVAVLLLRRK